MTTSNSDKLKLHRGSISSASVSNDRQSAQGPRYARSRLTIIPLPSTPVPSPQKPSQRPSRTSFSASSFSRRNLIPELPTYSQPLNPQQLYDLAISSLHLPDCDVAEGAVASTSTAPIGKYCSQPVPKYIPVTNGVYLPFADRKSEVASLFQHSVNTSFSKLVEVVFSDREQLSDFRRFVFETSREEADDQTWISTIRAILKPRSEILWTRLKTILGVPPELDEDDPQLHTHTNVPSVDGLSEISPDVVMQPIFPDQFTSPHRLVTPPRTNRRLRADTQPIIEEVESTPTEETASSQHEQREDDTSSPNGAGICIQTTPLFVPGITPVAPKPGMENAQYSQERGTRRLKRHGETNKGPLLVSSGGSSPSAALYSPSHQNNKRLNSKYHLMKLARNTDANRFSPSKSISTGSEVIPETREGNKEEEQGEKSDVSNTSSASSQSEGGFQDSGVITGTGDIAQPRKPLLQWDRGASDIPFRDLPTINAEHPPTREDHRDENRLDKFTIQKSDSPTLSTLSWSDNAVSSPHPNGPQLIGRPRFPASFSKCEPQSRSVRHPPFLTSSPEFPISSKDAVKDMRAGYRRSHTVSYPASSQHVDSSVTHTYPPPPPPALTTSLLDKKDTRSRRAVSLTQRHPSRLSGETREEDRDQQEGAEERGNLSVEVEGPMDSVRGTVNPLAKTESTDNTLKINK